MLEPAVCKYALLTQNQYFQFPVNKSLDLTGWFLNLQNFCKPVTCGEAFGFVYQMLNFPPQPVGSSLLSMRCHHMPSATACAVAAQGCL